MALLSLIFFYNCFALTQICTDWLGNSGVRVTSRYLYRSLIYQSWEVSLVLTESAGHWSFWTCFRLCWKGYWFVGFVWEARTFPCPSMECLFRVHQGLWKGTLFLQIQLEILSLTSPFLACSEPFLVHVRSIPPSWENFHKYCFWNPSFMNCWFFSLHKMAQLLSIVVFLLNVHDYTPLDCPFQGFRTFSLRTVKISLDWLFQTQTQTILSFWCSAWCPGINHWLEWGCRILRLEGPWFHSSLWVCWLSCTVCSIRYWGWQILSIALSRCR